MATLGTLGTLSSIVAGTNSTTALTINSSAGVQFNDNAGTGQLGSSCSISGGGVFNCSGLTISGPLTCSSIIIPNNGTIQCLGSFIFNSTLNMNSNAISNVGGLTISSGGLSCVGTLNMNNNAITNVGGLSCVGTLNMNNNAITNVGGLTISSGGLSCVGTLNMNSSEIKGVSKLTISDSGYIFFNNATNADTDANGMKGIDDTIKFWANNKQSTTITSQGLTSICIRSLPYNPQSNYCYISAAHDDNGNFYIYKFPNRTTTHIYQGGETALIYWNGTTTSGWAVSSDKNLKKNITYLNTCLESVLLLKPCTFQYKSSDDDSIINCGFIAQDIQEIYPELISNHTSNGEKYLGLAMSDLIPMLTKAVQELNTKIDNQSSEIVQLSSQNAAMSVEVASLTTQVSSLTTQNATLTSQVSNMAAEMDALIARVNLLMSNVTPVVN